MTFTSLDTIVRSVLLQKGLPLHWYMQLLKYSSDCYRELAFDSLRAINTVELLIDQRMKAANLPCDYIDWVKIGIPEGQFVRPLVQRDTINRLTNYTAQGQPITYGVPNNQIQDFFFWPGYWMYSNIDDLGENLGRMFGGTAGFQNNSFKVIPERGQIQFDETLAATVCVLEYISSGQAINNTTKIDLMSQACVEAYMDWKYKSHSKRFSAGEAEQAFQHYKIELRRFRARKDDVTIQDIRQTIFRNYIAAPKT